MNAIADTLKRGGSPSGSAGGGGARRWLITSLAVVAILVALGALLSPSPFFSVDQGELGVVLRFGRVAKIAEPGLNTKMPFVDSVVRISVRTQKQVYENLQSYSRDVQEASIRMSVNYRVKPDAVGDIYSRFGTEFPSRVIDPVVPQRLKEVFGQYNAQTVVAERVRLGQEVEKAIVASVPADILVEGVQIENIDFSDAYEQAIEAAAQAEAEVRKTRYELERDKVEAEKRVVVATAEAAATRQRAQADADAVRLRGDAEATAIAAKAKAFLDNPGYVNLIAVEKWNGSLPATQVPGSALPFITIPTQPTSAR
jgi:regulator of protease activity HflC (stomatin/prohibitin superfamily)